MNKKGTLPQIIVAAFGLGFFAPIILLMLYGYYFVHGARALKPLILDRHFTSILLALWPTAVFLLADPEDKNIQAVLISAVTNGLLYVLLGWLFWFGLCKKRDVLAFVLLCWW